MKIAVITGASSGLGREFARQISLKYKTIDELWVIARRAERLEELKALLETDTLKIRTIVGDVTSEEFYDEYKELLEMKKPSVRILVNAAGYGMIGRFDELNIEDNVGMCDVNCIALTKMTAITLPYMSGTRSNIINIASSAAFAPQPSFAVYAATKSYVLSLSTALNKELKDRNITVTAVCPGPVDTEFFDIAETYHSVKLYKRMLRAKAKNVVATALKDAYHGSHISVYGLSMKAFRLLSKLVPHSIIVKFIK